MQNCKKNAKKSEKKWSDRICWGLAGKKTGGESANGERGNPRPTKSRPRVKCSCSNFARKPESPFVHCTQPYGFACQPLRGLATSRNGELSKSRTRYFYLLCAFISDIE